MSKSTCHQREEGWGAKIIERIAKDLREEFPTMTGFSRANLMYMRSFASAWTKEQIVQAPLGQLTWYHHITLIEKVKNIDERMKYAELTVKNGWSRNVLLHQIELGTAKRVGKALTNFKNTLPEIDSDLAEQTLKSSYNLSFLGADEKIKENRLRAMLVDKVAKFLLELGAGFAYVGKAVPINVGGDDFEMDLLFYQLQLHCYFVIELKTRKFRPADVGQLGFYMTAVDRQVKAPSDRKTIGLLLCKSRNKVVVEYALADCEKPIGVSSYNLQLPRGLPSPQELEEKLSAVLLEKGN